MTEIQNIHPDKAIRFRLIVMNLFQWAVWGAYLTSMGTFLGKSGLGKEVGWFYAMQGFVSIFMPALMGIVADKYIPAQKLLGICHGIAGICMLAVGYLGMNAAGNALAFVPIFTLYSISVAFYMPTIALSNSAAFTALVRNGYDTVKDFPPIRVFGTVGFICAMLFVNFCGIKDGSITFMFKHDEAFISFQQTYHQFFVCGIIGLAMLVYSFTLPSCPVNKGGEKKSLVDALGIRAFTMFKDRNMAVFFIFSMLLGVALQITNGYANPFITHFGDIPQYADTFAANNANALISLSQICETLGILLIPVVFKKFGIKRVMIMSMVAWVLRFGFFGLGNPSSGVWLFILSMIVYGVAFDFFNISGALYTEQRASDSIKSSSQGLFMLMTNGVGASIGMLSAQAVVNHFVEKAATPNWSTAWFIFSGYALVVLVLFIVCFRDPGKGPYTTIA